MLIKKFKIIFYLFTISSITACFPLEKQTIPAKQPLPKMEVGEYTKKSIFTISGQLLDWRAKPLIGAFVTIHTQDTAVSVKTNDDGVYSAQIIQASNEPIIIEIKSNYGTAKYIYPEFFAEQGSLTLDLMLGADNSLDAI